MASLVPTLEAENPICAEPIRKNPLHISFQITVFLIFINRAYTLESSLIEAICNTFCSSSDLC